MIACLAAILSGLLLGFSRPIFGEQSFGLLVMFAYVPLFCFIQHASVKRTFWLGWTASLIQYAINIYWFIVAMHDFGNVPMWICGSVLFLSAAILALYMAVAFAAAQYLSHRFKWNLLVVMPISLMSIEYIRNYIIVGGFPWVASSYALTTQPVLLQAASVVGVYGLVYGIVLYNGALTHLLNCLRQKSPINKPFMGFAVIVMVSWMSYGSWRLLNEPPINGVVKVGLIQGNIGQGIKNHAFDHANMILAKYRLLSERALSDGAELLIWPESAYPLSVPREAPLIKNLGQLPAATIIGGVGFDDNHMYNSAFVLGTEANIIARVDKNHLVPFGEYVPWPFGAIVDRIVPGMGSFGRGKDFNPIEVKLNGDKAVKLGVTICYEGVFPEISRAFVENGAQLLVNITNDAWYGVSSAPYQHLAMYAMRAIETGRPYVRATNTGVSAWIDSRGFIHDKTALYEDAVVSASVPLDGGNTVYVWMGDMFPYLASVFMILAVMIAVMGKDFLLRRRSTLAWIIGGTGFAFVIWSHWYFSEAKLNLDEAAMTKDTFITMFGLIVGTLAWRKNLL